MQVGQGETRKQPLAVVGTEANTALGIFVIEAILLRPKAEKEGNVLL